MSRCLFCDETKLTQEHVWPDWLVREYKKRVPPKRGRYTATHKRADGNIHKFTAGSIERKELVVCGPCNHGWMSEIENHTKPYLLPLIFNEGEAVTIDEQSVCAIASWLALRDMVLDGTGEETRRYYSPRHRTIFRRGSTSYLPLSNTHIWLAYYSGEKHSANFHIVTQRITQNNGLHVLSGLLNRLAFKVVSWKGHKRTFNPDSIEAWRVATSRIWPFESVSDWPPNYGLTPAGFKAFHLWLSPKANLPPTTEL